MSGSGPLESVASSTYACAAALRHGWASALGGRPRGTGELVTPLLTSPWQLAPRQVARGGPKLSSSSDRLGPSLDQQRSARTAYAYPSTVAPHSAHSTISCVAPLSSRVWRARFTVSRLHCRQRPRR